MGWQCEHCKREFSKPYALTQHISQRYPYNHDHDISPNEKLDDNIWCLPDNIFNYDLNSDDYWVNFIKFVKFKNDIN
jgi:hypothetical protein